MKYALILLISFTSLSSFAGTLEVHCGEISKIKERKKNVLPFPIGPFIGGRLPALKIKLKHAREYIDAGAVGHGEYERVFRHKYAFSDMENYDKILARMEEALRIKKTKKVPVYACMGEVKGLDRWHKVASYSLTSPDDAFEILKKKYR